jgi:hypothetical protein
VRDKNPWLCQGDVFSEVPRLVVCCNERGAVQWSNTPGAALLLTDNCILDKRTSKAQKPKAKRLHFAPIRLLADASLEQDQIDKARRRELNPPEPVYLDLRAYDMGECVALIGETYPVPVDHFGGLTGTSDPNDSGDSFRSAIANPDRDSRICTMEQAEIDDLLAKMAFFWLHAEL